MTSWNPIYMKDDFRDLAQRCKLCSKLYKMLAMLNLHRQKVIKI